MTEELTIKRRFIPKLAELSAEAVVLLLYFVDRSYVQAELGIGLSVSEVARHVGLSTEKVRHLIDELRNNLFIEFNDLQTHIEITVSKDVSEDGGIIPFTYQLTDSTKLEVLENEVRRLRLSNERDRRGTASGLTDIYQGEEGDLYKEIEKRGYGITPSEAVLLGKCLAKFGVDRTRMTYRQMKRQKNPLMATYAALERGIRGKGAKPSESQPFTQVHYRDLD